MKLKLFKMRGQKAFDKCGPRVKRVMPYRDRVKGFLEGGGDRKVPTPLKPHARYDLINYSLLSPDVQETIFPSLHLWGSVNIKA